MSVKGESLSPDSAVGPTSSGNQPRVVVGIPDSDPPAAPETPAPVVEMKAPVTMPSFTKTLVQDFIAEIAKEPREPETGPHAVMSEAEASTAITEVERVAELPPQPEPVRAAAEPAPEPVAAAPIIEEPATIPDAPKGLAKTLVHGSSAPVEIDPKKTLVSGSTVPEEIKSALLPQAKDRLEEIRQRKENRDRLKQKRAVAEAKAKADAPADPDEISVPPAGDLEVEDQTFFERGEKEAHAESQRYIQAAAEADADAMIPEKARRKSMPHIVQRRAKLAGYVKVAVAGAAIVCLAALGRTAIHKAPEPPPITATHAEIKAPEPPPVAQPAPVEVKAAEPAAAPVPAVTPSDEAAKPAEPAATAAPADTAAAAPADTAKPEEVTGDPKEELKKAHIALERRKIADAIEAGEKSVTLDPTNAEAWLILGAAYQEKGDMVNARRCYSSCVKEGKTGPRLECQRMLRF